MKCNVILGIISMLFLISSTTAVFSESDSIEAVIDVEPYNDNMLSIDVRFIDVIGQLVNHVNYSISAKYNNELILDDTGVHVHTGTGNHLTSPISDTSSGTLEITITFAGIGLSEPYGGPIGKVYTFSENLISNQNIHDFTAPLIIMPDNITKESDNSFGAIVHYTVKAIDDIDGVLDVNCDPSSGSIFRVGTTIVECSSIDEAKNKSIKSFTITIEDKSGSSIPSWVRNIASFWCNDEIDDSGFIEGIQYLIQNNVIVIYGITTGATSHDEIPSWIKNNACWWSSGLIPDDEFVKGLQYLVQTNIIKL